MKWKRLIRAGLFIIFWIIAWATILTWINTKTDNQLLYVIGYILGTLGGLIAIWIYTR